MVENFRFSFQPPSQPLRVAGKTFPKKQYQENPLFSLQYINHIPKGSSICRKDNLVRYLRCMRKVYGSIYDFSPDGFNLPLEYTKLAAECNRSRSLPAKAEITDHFPEEKPIWICKPVAQSQGKGIFLFRVNTWTITKRTHTYSINFRNWANWLMTPTQSFNVT